MEKNSKTIICVMKQFKLFHYDDRDFENTGFFSILEENWNF